METQSSENTTVATVTAATVTSMSLSDLDLTKKCESVFEFEYINALGKGTGIFFSVLGSQAPKVQAWVRKSVNARRTQDALQVKRGKDEIVQTVEDDEEFGAAAAAVRLVGWRGITEEYAHANALRLMTINAEIRGQVFKASNELANFTKG